MVGDSLFHYLRFHITEKLPAGYKIFISTTALMSKSKIIDEEIVISATQIRMKFDAPSSKFQTNMGQKLNLGTI